jgi:phage terminase Nu1 subunit (DNA packaging protein)
MKRGKKPTAAPEPARESTSDLAASIFHESLSAIRDEIRGIVTKKIKPKGHDPASRVAWLAKQAASVAAEQRKAEAGELAAIRKLSHATVITWLKAQTVEARARVARELAAIDSRERKSVLG